MEEKDKKINNVIEFHKKDDADNVNDVEEDNIDDAQRLLEQEYEDSVQQCKRCTLTIDSIKGQIAFVEKIWKDFNISEFEIKRRKNFYNDLLCGKKMTCLINKLNAVKDTIERKCILKEILEVYVKAYDIVEKLYDLDFPPRQTSASEEIESETSKSL